MGDDYRVGIYETLAEYTTLDPKGFLFRVIAITIICDVGCATALSVIMDGPLGMKTSADNFSTFFYNYTADCVYLAIFRCLVLPFIAYCAVKTGDRSPISSQCDCFRCFYSSKSYEGVPSTDSQEDSRPTWESHGEIGQPLLSSKDVDNRKVRLTEK